MFGICVTTDKSENHTLANGMKFIVDAQLPYRMALFIRHKGFDVLHTNDLPDKERTSDDYIRIIAQQDDRIVITKDSDFVDSFTLKSIPEKLFLIITGNIKNPQLLLLLEQNWNEIIETFKTCNLVEMSNTSIIGY